MDTISTALVAALLLIPSTIATAQTRAPMSSPAIVEPLPTSPSVTADDDEIMPVDLEDDAEDVDDVDEDDDDEDDDDDHEYDEIE